MKARKIEVIDDYTGMIVEEVKGGCIVWKSEEQRAALPWTLCKALDAVQSQSRDIEITTTLRRRTPEELAEYREEQRLLKAAEELEEERKEEEAKQRKKQRRKEKLQNTVKIQ